jgi:hypothetical protein
MVVNGSPRGLLVQEKRNGEGRGGKWRNRYQHNQHESILFAHLISSSPSPHFAIGNVTQTYRLLAFEAADPRDQAGPSLGKNVHDNHPIAKVVGASTKPGWGFNRGDGHGDRDALVSAGRVTHR